jgi:hypothetical protein
VFTKKLKFSKLNHSEFFQSKINREKSIGKSRKPLANQQQSTINWRIRKSLEKCWNFRENRESFHRHSNVWVCMIILGEIRWKIAGKCLDNLKDCMADDPGRKNPRKVTQFPGNLDGKNAYFLVVLVFCFFFSEFLCWYR